MRKLLLFLTAIFSLNSAQMQDSHLRSFPRKDYAAIVSENSNTIEIGILNSEGAIQTLDAIRIINMDKFLDAKLIDLKIGQTIETDEATQIHIKYKINGIQCYSYFEFKKDKPYDWTFHDKHENPNINYRWRAGDQQCMVM